MWIVFVLYLTVYWLGNETLNSQVEKNAVSSASRHFHPVCIADTRYNSTIVTVLLLLLSDIRIPKVDK